MAASVLFEGQIEIPLGLQSLADFRNWSLGDDYPETGRIDFLNGRIEVEMAAEDLFFHGALKSEIAAVLYHRAKAKNLGRLFSDRTRVSSPAADLSAEPDVVFLSYQSLRSGAVRLVPKAGGKPGRYVEIEGGPDLIVEIVSDASVQKDTVRLPGAYFQAGVREFWLADSRGDELVFVIHRRVPAGFVAVETDAGGFQPSAVFGCLFRLGWRPDVDGNPVFDLEVKETP